MTYTEQALLFLFVFGVACVAMGVWLARAWRHPPEPPPEPACEECWLQGFAEGEASARQVGGYQDTLVARYEPAPFELEGPDEPPHYEPELPPLDEADTFLAELHAPDPEPEPPELPGDWLAGCLARSDTQWLAIAEGLPPGPSWSGEAPGVRLAYDEQPEHR